MEVAYPFMRSITKTVLREKNKDEEINAT